LAITSVAIIAWFRKYPNGRNVWTRVGAPGLATIGLTAIFVLILVNFDLMIEAEEGSALIYILPGIVIGAGVIGLIWGRLSKTDAQRITSACGIKTNSVTKKNSPSLR